MRRPALVISLTLCVVAVACGGSSEPSTVAARDAIAVESSTTAVDSASVSTAPIPSTPTTTAAPTTTVPTFTSAVGPIDVGRLPYSWRPGCPVAVSDLRLLTLTYWGFDDRSHHGELVVHQRYADAIVSVFAQLFDARFPIERMELVDAYEGNDDRSMVANNTSAFNCREVAGRPGVMSEHSLGGAIDINPLINPWVHYGKVDPPEGAQYADRSKPWKGAIYADDLVVRAFAAIGWGWGGAWPDSHDYQHFSASGR